MGNGPWTQGGRESGGGMQGQVWEEWTGTVDGAEEEASRVWAEQEVTAD